MWLHPLKGTKAVTTHDRRASGRSKGAKTALTRPLISLHPSQVRDAWSECEITPPLGHLLWPHPVTVWRIMET